MNYQPLLWAAVVATLLGSPALAQGNGHPPSYPFLCGTDTHKLFSQFINIGGGLYWNGGGVDEFNGEAGLVVFAHGFAARSLTMQYQVGPSEPGPQSERNVIAFIFFTDGSNTSCNLVPNQHLTKGFSISPAGHGFNNLTWNAATAGMSDKSLAEVGFVDFGRDDGKASFQSFVTRVYVNGVLAAPQLNAGLSSFCD